MIDPTLRLEAIAALAAADEPAVLLLDVVLGYGADPDPAAALVPALTAAREAAEPRCPWSIALVGTEGDPQGWSRQADALAAAGAARLRLQRRRHAVRPRPAGSLVMTLGGLLSAPPAIVAAGVDVFSDALRAQGAEVHDVDWRPPGFGEPDDLADAGAGPAPGLGQPDGRRADPAPRARVLVDVRPAREVHRPARPDAAALRPAADLGDRLRPDARRADRRLPVRGLGDRRRGRRADPGRRRDHARPVPPPPHGRARWPA